MKYKKIIFPILALILITGISVVIATKNMSSERASEVTTASNTAETAEMPSNQAEQPAQSALDPGRYAEYTAENAADQSYSRTILFFHAGWCPECRSFRKAIESSAIPEGVQVLEVNYDTASDLKKQHKVTLQSTFVKVDSAGNQLSKWVGYGKNKSLQTVLNNL